MVGGALHGVTQAGLDDRGAGIRAQVLNILRTVHRRLFPSFRPILFATGRELVFMAVAHDGVH
jgi:hypothetical protein